ncbi:hypothetical protein ACLMJK_009732 [Lecanora helva]
MYSGDQTRFNGILNTATNFTKLDPKSCIQHYTPTGFGAQGNVVVVTGDTNGTGQLFGWGSVMLEQASGVSSCCDEAYDTTAPWEPYYEGSYASNIGEWLCSKDRFHPNLTSQAEYCDFKSLLADQSPWTLHGHQVEYCLSESVPETCSVGFIPSIMIVVLVCTALKVFVATYLLICRKHFMEARLTSVGDAIVSFLQFPASANEADNGAARDGLHNVNTETSGKADVDCPNASSNVQASNERLHIKNLASTTLRTRRRWFESAPSIQWLLCILITIASAITVLTLVVHWTKAYFGTTSFSSTAINTIGFGKANLLAVLGGNYSIMQMVIISNLPQFALVAVFYLYTDIFTRMLSARAWSDLSRTAKALRVAIPRGEQRGTYFLGMPLRYGVPFLALSVLLHWTTSQTIFPVALAITSADKELLLPGRKHDLYGGNAGLSSPGFSPIGAITTACLLFFLMISTIAIGFRKFDPRAPVIGCSSLEIRNAVRPLIPWTRPMVEGKMKYQVIGETTDGYLRYGFWSHVEKRS